MSKTLFSAREVRVGYGRCATDAPSKEERADGPVLAGVTFDLKAGEIYDLRGVSGAGKSTLLRACARMMPYQGEFLLAGKPARSFAPAEWRRQVCLVPQKPALVDGTVRDNLLLPWRMKVRAGMEPPADRELRGLMTRAGMVDVSLDKDVAQLSGGQVARIALLRAFAAKPQVLLLDEVDAALDDATSEAISALTRMCVDESATCLRIRHRAGDGLARGVFFLEEGALQYREADGPLGEEGAAEAGAGAGASEQGGVS